MKDLEIAQFDAKQEDSPVYGRKARVGLLALSTDLSIERDFGKMLPGDDVGLYTTRIHFAVPSTFETLSALADEIPGAVKLLIPTSKLDVVVFGCTSASTVIGTQRVETLVHSVRPGVKCTNPATAALEALRALHAKKIAVLAPYPKPITADVAGFMAENGFEITAAGCLGIDNDADIARVRSDQYIKATRHMCLNGAEALFISCTATTAIDAIASIEDEFSLPVVTANQATVWHSLKLVGWETPIAGHGRLLERIW